MANEAVSIEKTVARPVIRRVGAGGPKIIKGTLLHLGDNNTVVASAVSGVLAIFGGVAATDRVSGTTVAAYMDGVWDMKVAATNAVTMGAQVIISGANLIADAAAGDLLTGSVVGTAEEIGGTGEVIRVRLNT